MEITREKSLYEAIEWAKAQYPEWPQSLKKPFLDRNASATDAHEYAKKLEQYEKALVTHKEERRIYGEKTLEINATIEVLIKVQAGLEKVPEKSRSKVWSKAYQDGHSSGYYQVYQELCELVELFED